jgi:hypothetical protein
MNDHLPDRTWIPYRYWELEDVRIDFEGIER